MSRSTYTSRPVGTAVVADPLAPFSPAVRAWFEATFEAPTPAQTEGWAAISAGHHTLIHAPTGSGKTLAAFLWTLDRLDDFKASDQNVDVKAIPDDSKPGKKPEKKDAKVSAVELIKDVKCCGAEE